MNNYNKIYSIFVCVFLTTLLMLSCHKYMDFPTEGEVPTEDFFTNTDEAQSSIYAMYAQLRNWSGYGGLTWLALAGIVSDDILKGSNTTDGGGWAAYDNFTFSDNQQNAVNEQYTSQYKIINLANQSINNIPAIEMDESLKKQLIGEAKFVRALSYFALVRLFGEVPLVTTFPVSSEEVSTRVSVSAVYSQIEQDLQDAYNTLPDSWSAADRGRATKWAARGLLAKIYMYEEKWSECVITSDDVIQNGYGQNGQKLDLYPDFFQLFRTGQEYCQESLFEVVATADPSLAGLGNAQYSQVRGWRGGAGGQNLGWGWGVPSDDLIEAFDQAGDAERKAATVLMENVTLPDGTIFTSFDGTPYGGITVPRVNGKAYVPADELNSIGSEGADQNYRILRFADVLLINAEAKVHMGDNAGALVSINRVRDRVSLPPLTGTVTLQQVWDERRLELAGEENRFFDLVRTGQAPSVLGPLGFQTGKNELYAIPPEQIELSGGSLTQNPGW